MKNEYRIPLMDLVFALSSVADMVSPLAANHHTRVAYMSARIAGELGLSPQEEEDVVVAAGLHDLGSFSAQERVDLRNFELAYPQRHAEVGYLFLKRFPPFQSAAEIIRYHHLPWQNGQGKQVAGKAVSPLSHIVHLADRIDVLIDPDIYVLSQCEFIRKKIQGSAGSIFNPEYVAAFEKLSYQEAFWLDVCSPTLDRILRNEVWLSTLVVDLADLIKLSQLLSHIIDFKSPFTSAHTVGVASTAVSLAKLAGFSVIERKHMMIAALLHDLGKLAIPGEILEKTSALSDSEFEVMRSHTYYTRRILDCIPGFETISDWASNHHERLDGQGYPFKETNLSLGARILTVADVFTALTEDRPYREGMEQEMVAEVMGKMVSDHKLDSSIVQCLIDNYQEIDFARADAQLLSSTVYEEILGD